MKEHDHHCTANTTQCFRTFIGCRIKGLLKNILPIGRPDLAAGNKTLVFECGWGLTIASNGSYWTESPNEIAKAISVTKDNLSNTKAEIEGVLGLAGERVS